MFAWTWGGWLTHNTHQVVGHQETYKANCNSHGRNVFVLRLPLALTIRGLGVSRLYDQRDTFALSSLGEGV